MIELTIQLEQQPVPINVQTTIDEPIVGLFGPSGAGKSTLLHCIAGLRKADRGRIVIDDELLTDTVGHVYQPMHRRGVGLVFQDGRLFEHKTVNANLRYGMQRAGGATSQPGPTFDAVVDLLQLHPHLHRHPAQLSGGERQRVAVGRAVLSNPRVLLLDEPLTGLDRAHRIEIIPFLKRLVTEIDVPTLYVTHDLTEILQLTDHLLLMNRGTVVAQGRYLDLVQDASIPRVAFSGGVVNVIPMTVARHDKEHGSTVVTTQAQADKDASSVDHVNKWSIPAVDMPVGGIVSVSFGSTEVALSDAPIPRTSIQNQIPGKVVRVCDRQGWSIVEIDAGVPILAQIGQASVERLSLEPGRSVCCLIKASAMTPLAGGR